MGPKLRRAKRHRVEYLATMLTGKGTPARYCAVTELSDGGIRINATGYTAPDEFGLRLTGSAVPRLYKVVWRNGHDVGAKLLVPTPAVAADSAEIHAK